MSKLNNLADFLTDLANAIRAKKGITGVINAQNMANEIASISTGITPTGNIELQQQTGTDVTNYATASVKSGSASVSEVSITVPLTVVINSSTGIITASHSATNAKKGSKTAGWIAAGDIDFNVVTNGSQTLQLPTQAYATITPSKYNQVACAAGKYTVGQVIVLGDSHLDASNIKKDVTIFGVTGAYTADVTYNAFALGCKVGGEESPDTAWNGQYRVQTGVTWGAFIASDESDPYYNPEYSCGPIVMNIEGYGAPNQLVRDEDTGVLQFSLTGAYLYDENDNMVYASDEINDGAKYYQYIE